MTRGRGRVLGIVGVGLLCALATGRAEPPKPTELGPAVLPALPALPPQPGGAIPSPFPFDASAKPQPLPAAPAAPPAVVPDFTVPSAPKTPGLPIRPVPKFEVPNAPQVELPQIPPPEPAVSVLVKPPTPAEPEITEPVVTVHRFKGKYLGGDSTRALVYVETGDGKAEVQSRPFAAAIPPADVAAKDDVKRIEVPAGEVKYHAGRVFLTTKREFLVIDGACNIDWKFTLPGKADNGENLLGVVGFYGGNAVLASQHTPPRGTDKPTGRAHTFDTATGRQVGFATVAGGFDAGAKLSLDVPHGTLMEVAAERYRVFELATGAERWAGRIMHGATDAATSGGIVFVNANGDLGMPGRGVSGFEMLAHHATGTAPPQFAPERGVGRAYVPLRWLEGKFSLAVFDITPDGNLSHWRVHVAKAISAPPVVRGDSVYFVAGNVVYRVSAATGTVHWKHTLALNPGETLTDLAFVGGELRASGPGVLARVAERAEPKPPLLIHFGLWPGGNTDR